MKFSTEKINNIVKMYKEGKSQKEIADFYGTFNTSIRRVLIREGVNIRSLSELLSYVKIDVFSDLTSSTVNYWLGWLISDGCVYRQRVTLQVQETDIEVVEEFKKFLGNKVIVKKIIHSKYKKVGYRIDFKKRGIEDILYSYGITSNKSLTIELTIPLNFPMLLGIFEGDGSFTLLGKEKKQGRFSITSGSKKLLIQIQSFLAEEGITSTITTNTLGIHDLNVYRKKQLVLLYNKLYENAPFFLKRKKEKFGSFVQKCTM